MGDWYEWIGSTNRKHDEMQHEFDRLAQDAPRPLKVGDRVVTAAGLVGRGHQWIRAGATVLEVGQTSVRVRFDKPGWNNTPDEDWIHQAIVTDVLASEPIA